MYSTCILACTSALRDCNVALIILVACFRTEGLLPSAREKGMQSHPSESGGRGGVLAFCCIDFLWRLVLTRFGQWLFSYFHRVMSVIERGGTFLLWACTLSDSQPSENQYFLNKARDKSALRDSCGVCAGLVKEGKEHDLRPHRLCILKPQTPETRGAP